MLTLVLFFKYMCIYVNLCAYIRRSLIYNVYVQRVSSLEGRDDDDSQHYARLRKVVDELCREEALFISATELSRGPPLLASGWIVVVFGIDVKFKGRDDE